MYVCNCNGITEKEVETAIRSGVEDWDGVHEFYGCEPCCGQCECEIKDAMADARSEPVRDTGPMFAMPEMAAAG